MVKKVRKQAHRRNTVSHRDSEIRTVVRDLSAKPEHLQLVDLLYNKLKKVLNDVLNKEGVSASNIIIIIDAAMKLTGELKTLSGIEKKAIVIAVVKKLIAESDLKPEDAQVVGIIAERALDPTIDQLFAMAPQIYGKVRRSCVTIWRR